MQKGKVQKRINVKLTSLCFKSLNGSAHTYLSDLLHLYTYFWQLRSSADTQVFRIPSFHSKSSGWCSFFYQAPAMWNKCPTSSHHASSVSFFTSSSKTFLLWKTFSSVPLPWGACMRQGVCLCACVCVSACAYVCCLCVQTFDIQMYMYVLDL